jgi:hypothetical protein
MEFWLFDISWEMKIEVMQRLEAFLMVKYQKWFFNINLVYGSVSQ